MQALGFGLEQAFNTAGETAQTETALMAPVHPQAKLLLAHWRARSDGFIVGRDLPSRPLARVLTSLSLWDYCHETRDFRARLAGFALTRHFGRDIATRRLGELMPPADHARQRSLMMTVFETGEPCSLDLRIKNARRSAHHLEALILKALAADRRTPLILFGLFYDEGWWQAA